jgi:hypothetical protein
MDDLAWYGVGTNYKSDLKPVLRIRDILVRIRFRESVPPTNGSAIFVSDLQDGNKTVGIKVFLTIFA